MVHARVQGDEVDGEGEGQSDEAGVAGTASENKASRPGRSRKRQIRSL